MNWITLVMLSSLITSGNNLLDKRLMTGRHIHPFVCTASFGIVGLVPALIGLVLLPSIPWPETLMGITAGTLFVGAAWLYYDTVAREDISRLVPLLRLTSLQTLLLAVIFLGESLSEQQLRAFGVMLVSGIILSLQSNSGGSGIIRSSALRMLPVTALLAVNNILNAQLYRTTSVWHGIVWENVGMILSLVVAGSLLYWRKRAVKHTGERRVWGVLILEQSTRLLATIVSAQAVASGAAVGLISALSGLQLFLVWLLAVLLLREPTSRRDVVLKAIGMLGMTLGIYWLTI